MNIKDKYFHSKKSLFRKMLTPDLRLVTKFALGSMVVIPCLFAGCTPRSSPNVTKQEAAPAAMFTDVAATANIKFTHVLGNSGRFFFDEFTPSGCAFFDYDNDGFLDVFLVQSGSSAVASTVKNRPFCALLHNERNGTFREVTSKSGLDKDLGYGQGVAVGDYDNDGYDDLFMTAYGGNHLFRNLKGSGKFQEVTQSLGLDSPRSGADATNQLWATSAAWGDYDGDGRLDLYVCYYAKWSHSLDKECRDSKTGALDYCSPSTYEAATHRLFHNEANRFVDVSVRAGITKSSGRALAVGFFDFNKDGRQDIFVANDGMPALLWKNNGNSTFSDVADQAGCAYDGQGHTIAGMSVTFADYNHTGRPSVYVSNFSATPNILFRNEGGVFSDVTQEANLGFSHLSLLSFGSEFFDYDADGWVDIISNNGHVQMQANKRAANVPLKQRKQLLRNNGQGGFQEIKDAQILGDLNHPVIGRGLAIGDYDNDGRLDVLGMAQNAPAQLLHNGNRNGNHWVSFSTVGVKSNRNGVGARLEIEADGTRQTSWVHGGSSYLSHSDRRVYFGLGKANTIKQLSIVWPSGKRETLRDLKGDVFYTLTEGKGVTHSHTAGASKTTGA